MPSSSGEQYPELALPDNRHPFGPHRVRLHRLWLHILLLLLTLFSTTLIGAGMQYNFSHNLPFFDGDHLARVYLTGLQSPSAFLTGLPFSLSLLAVLMAHEMGHYLACMYYGIDASLPYFLPSPMPVTGTFGAFIRIRSAIMSKRILFDIGIAGPIAGFIFLLPALGVGLAFSKVLPGIQHQGDLHLGTPALQLLAQKLIFPGVAPADIYLHPIARAAWVGMFATALNLLPVGQLDGGHIVYALTGRFHRLTTWLFLGVLVVLGKFWTGWWFWAVLLFFFARKHPPLYDEMDAGGARIRLGFTALVLFLLCFTIVPIAE
ncbi:MAG: Peptidase [Bryobacterales bacterium]|nr:Peptidase [Bryobacterales bacterium]